MCFFAPSESHRYCVHPERNVHPVLFYFCSKCCFRALSRSVRFNPKVCLLFRRTYIKMQINEMWEEKNHIILVDLSWNELSWIFKQISMLKQNVEIPNWPLSFPFLENFYFKRIEFQINVRRNDQNFGYSTHARISHVNRSLFSGMHPLLVTTFWLTLFLEQKKSNAKLSVQRYVELNECIFVCL